MNQREIISLGSVNADFQVRVERRPEVSETLLAHDFVQLSGGKAANVAYLARRLEVPAKLLAHVGDDALRVQALRPLQEIGVDLTYVRAIEGSATGVSMIAVPPDGKKGIILASNANDAWTEADLADVQEAISNAPAGSVLVVDYEIPAFVVECAIQTAHQRNLPVILDPSPADRVEAKLFPLVHSIVPNASEAQGLTGIAADSVDAAIQAARRLVDQGVKKACFKLNDGGCVVVNRQRAVHIPSVPVEVVDTTGAGDAFAGALAVAVLEGRSLTEAAKFAVAASHHSVTRYGSQPAYPNRGEINDLLKCLSENAYGTEQ